MTDEGEYPIFPFFFRLFRWLFRNKTNNGESNNSNKINKIANGIIPIKESKVKLPPYNEIRIYTPIITAKIILKTVI